MSDAQSRWENQRDIDCAEHGQPKCPKFPDHDCEECHFDHKEKGYFNEFCSICIDEKCSRAKALVKQHSNNEPDWNGKCDNCGESPTVPDTGMCGPCTFGEADTAGGNW